MKLGDYYILFTVLTLVPCSGLGQTCSTPATASPHDSTPLKPGVVVEKFEAQSAGAKVAGMQEGDILLNWSRGDAKGELGSPFELSTVLTEQLLQGPVRFEGFRGSEKRVWVGTKLWWGAITRPNFSDTLLLAYREGEKLAEAGKPIEAAERWRALADEAQRSRSPWLGPWFLFQAAQLLANGQHWKEADDAYQEATLRAEKSGPDVRAQLLFAWASTFSQRSDYDRAEKYLQEAVVESQQAGAENLRAKEFDSLGWIARGRGDLAKAEKYLRQSQDIAEKLEPDSVISAQSLINLGVIFGERGDLAKAEEYYRRAQIVFERSLPGSIGAAVILDDLGDVAHRRGELDRAEEHYRGALRIYEKILPGTLEDATILTDLATVVDQRGDDKQAEELLRRALAIDEKLAPGGSEEASARQALGNVALRRNDFAAAERFYLQALAIRKKLAPEGLYTAETLSSLGHVSLKRGDLVGSERYYRQALGIREKFGPGSADHAEVLAALAAIARTKQQPEKAAQLYEQTLNALESQTAHLGGSEEQRAGFRAKYQNYYKDYIDLLAARHQPERAFEVLERARARSLLETLGEAQVDIHKGVDAILIERERSLQTAILGKSDRRIRLLSGNHTEEQISGINKELAGLVAQYHEVEGQIRETSPVYAALTQPQPLSTGNVQQLLDPDTVLVAYSLGEKRSHAFLVTIDSIRTYRLPPRTAIERAARRVYQLLIARNRQMAGETLAQRSRRWAAAESQYPKAADELGRMVLGPITGEINAKRLLVVGDGALQYIPFAVLPASSQHPRPLVADHEIVNLPSASVLAMLRRAEITRKPATKSVAVLADPVFSEEDARVSLEHSGKSIVSAPQSTGGFSNDTLARSAHDVGLFSLPRLPFSRQEADAILSVAPAGGGLEALDFRASRATATSPELEQYRIVHIATHGLLDSQHPELSGLVLSLVDEKGNPKNGFMALNDIYNLNWPADLVVLSACETGLGKEVRGEGLIGLTQGFMYAGASRVVASLWSVDDVATAAFMADFYKAMLRQGLPPASALRKAQMQMRKQKRWRNPYYWGAFIIQGEWRPAAER